MNKIKHLLAPFLIGITRTPIKSIGTTFLLSVLFFVIFLLLLLGFVIQHTGMMAEKKIDIVFFFEDEVAEHKIDLTLALLQKMKARGEIQDFTYFSSDDATLQFALKYPDSFEFWQRNVPNENPLPPMFELVPKRLSITDLENIFSAGEYRDTISQQMLQETKQERDRSVRVLEFLGFLEKGIFLLTLIIFIAVASITAALIASSLLLKRREIFIMRLVGAKFSFIRTPFLVEGVLFALISLLFGWGIFYTVWELGKQHIVSFLSPTQQLNIVENLNQMWFAFFAFLPWVVIFTIILSLLSSFITVERSLRTQNILSSS